MMSRRRAAPPNSLIVIADIGRGEIGDPNGGAPIYATPSAICVACFPADDGPTEFVLADAASHRPERPPDFDGMLETPGRKVVIWTVDDRKLMTAAVPAMTTRIRIWRSHPRWPETVTIVWG